MSHTLESGEPTPPDQRPDAESAAAAAQPAVSEQQSTADPAAEAEVAPVAVAPLTSVKASGAVDGPPPVVVPPEGDVLPEADLATAPESAAPTWTVSFGFNLAKIAGHGEDSDPILGTGRDEMGLVAVFDGMGGAGGTVYQTPDGPRTGAFLGSRVAREVVEQRMSEVLNVGDQLDGPAAAEDLRRCVEVALAARLAELHAPRSGLRSKLLRALPTTMALAAVQRREPDDATWTCHLWWAGDSRVYALDPTRGAHQLTIDDIRDQGDALANLRDDSVVSNAMSADTPFEIHYRTVELSAPFLLVAATDGCFGYFRSPMHFEHLILATLLDTPDTQSWSNAVQEQITAITGDDASMALLGAGADHDGFRTLFADRLTTLANRWVTPLDELTTEVDQRQAELETLRERQSEHTAELWADYKVDYLRYLAPPTPVAGPS
ncbi:MAG: protein phosphatase 2C domain-containing protein [Actinomycetota bacterium]|nr:protein phosphatase 2C domain-containing protein [Actinomycetota bacterium]